MQTFAGIQLPYAIQSYIKDPTPLPRYYRDYLPVALNSIPRRLAFRFLAKYLKAIIVDDDGLAVVHWEGNGFTVFFNHNDIFKGEPNTFIASPIIFE